MDYILQSKRLFLRAFSIEDAADFYQLNQDPEVIKYTGDRPFHHLEEARLFLQNYDHYQRYGYGRWAVIRKADAQYLGWCGLKYSPSLDETDIGFRFFRKYWGQGYATEAARASLDYGLNKLNCPFIVGRARKDNKTSIRVLEKIGMYFWKEALFDDGHPAVFYKA